jgi:hypothetical protein
VRYALFCERCGARIVVAAHVGDDEANAIAEHLRAEHPDLMPADRRPDFATLLGYVRVRMTNGGT